MSKEIEKKASPQPLSIMERGVESTVCREFAGDPSRFFALSSRILFCLK